MYEKRFDGRDWLELREIEAKTGVIKNADGSAFFRMGNTSAYCAVYGPRTLLPKFLQNPKKGLLRTYYWMMPFSGIGNRVKPAPSRRAIELSMVIEKALEPVINLEEFPNAVIDVFIALPQTDAGSRCVAINAASLALADAGIPMKDLVVALAVGRVDDKLVVDLTYDEEAYKDGPVADIPFAIIPSKKQITLLQGDGEITKEMFEKLLEIVEKPAKQIYEIQIKALKAKFLKKYKE